MTLVPVRLHVLNALTDLFAGISQADGYANDMGADTFAPQGRVFRGRSHYGENDPLPMISIVEDPRNFETTMAPSVTGNSITTGDWQLLVQGFVEDDQLHPTDPAYALLADIRRALGLEIERHGRDRNLFGLGPKVITGIKIGAGVVRPPDEVSAKAYCWLPVTLTISERNVEPYSLPNP